MLDGGIGILDAGIRSGSRIELVAPSPASRFRRQAQAAVLRVLAGPDAGKEFPLPGGVSVIGRDHGVDLRLTDPLISKRHARINVGDRGRDHRSELGQRGAALRRPGLPGGAHAVRCGGAGGHLALRSLPLGRGRDAGPVVEHVRSPRVVPRYPGREFEAPKPPALAQPQRFPLVALAAPLIMGAVIYAIQPQIMAVLMMALSPVLLVGALIDQTIDRPADAQDTEEEVRRSMLAAAGTPGTRTRGRTPRPAGRGPVRPPSAGAGHRAAEPAAVDPPSRARDFLALNLGVGRAASRNEVVAAAAERHLPRVPGISWRRCGRVRRDRRGADPRRLCA